MTMLLNLSKIGLVKSWFASSLHTDLRQQDHDFLGTCLGINTPKDLHLAKTHPNTYKQETLVHIQRPFVGKGRERRYLGKVIKSTLKVLQMGSLHSSKNTTRGTAQTCQAQDRGLSCTVQPKVDWLDSHIRPRNTRCLNSYYVLQPAKPNHRRR